MKNFVPQFSSAEYQRRHEAVRKVMQSENLDCLLVPVSENMTYLTNITMMAFGAYLLFPLSGEPVLFTNPIIYRNKASVNKQANIFGAYCGGEGSVAVEESSMIKDIRDVMPPSFVAEIAKWLKTNLSPDADRIGIVGRELDGVTNGGGLLGMTGPLGLNPMFYQSLQLSVPNFEFLDGSNILVKTRRIKSQEEIESIKNATCVADACSLAIKDEIKKPDCKEGDIYAAYWDTLYRNGGGDSWWFMVSVNPTDKPQVQQYHIHPYDLSIRWGDIIMAEILPVWKDGYLGHAEVCFVLGNAKQQKIYEMVNRVCLDSYHAVVSVLKPGTTAEEIMRVGDEPILSAGMMRCAPLVYGIGLFGMEPPMVGIPMGTPAPDLDKLEQGMTVLVISHVIDPQTQVCVRTGTTHLITNSGNDCFNDETIPLGMLIV